MNHNFYEQGTTVNTDTLNYTYPRTIEQAFGPNEHGPLHDPDDDYPSMSWIGALALYFSIMVFSFFVVTLLKGLFE